MLLYDFLVFVYAFLMLFLYGCPMCLHCVLMFVYVFLCVCTVLRCVFRCVIMLLYIACVVKSVRLRLIQIACFTHIFRSLKQGSDLRPSVGLTCGKRYVQQQNVFLLLNV